MLETTLMNNSGYTTEHPLAKSNVFESWHLQTYMYAGLNVVLDGLSIETGNFQLVVLLVFHFNGMLL